MRTVVTAPLPRSAQPAAPPPSRRTPTRDLLSAYDLDVMRARLDRLVRVAERLLAHAPLENDQRILAADAMLGEALDLRARIEAAGAGWVRG